MEKINTTNVVAPALGGFSGIVLADVLSQWLATTKVGETTGAWTPVITSSLVGLAGVALLPKGSATMKTAGVAFAGASFGLAISNTLRAMGVTT